MYVNASRVSMYQFTSHHQSKVLPIPKMVARSANYNAEIHEPPEECQLVTIATSMVSILSHECTCLDFGVTLVCSHLESELSID